MPSSPAAATQLNNGIFLFSPLTLAWLSCLAQLVSHPWPPLSLPEVLVFAFSSISRWGSISSVGLRAPHKKEKGQLQVRWRGGGAARLLRSGGAEHCWGGNRMRPHRPFSLHVTLQNRPGCDPTCPQSPLILGYVPCTSNSPTAQRSVLLREVCCRQDGAHQYKIAMH